MKQFKDSLWEWIFFINEIAILFLIINGINYVDSRYNIPSSITLIVIVSIFVKEQITKEKKNKEKNHQKLDELYSILGEDVRNSLTLSQTLDITNIFVKKD